MEAVDLRGERSVALRAVADFGEIVVLAHREIARDAAHDEPSTAEAERAECQVAPRVVRLGGGGEIRADRAFFRERRVGWSLLEFEVHGERLSLGEAERFLRG